MALGPSPGAAGETQRTQRPRVAGAAESNRSSLPQEEAEMSTGDNKAVWVLITYSGFPLIQFYPNTSFACLQGIVILSQTTLLARPIHLTNRSKPTSDLPSTSAGLVKTLLLQKPLGRLSPLTIGRKQEYVLVGSFNLLIIAECTSGYPSVSRETFLHLNINEKTPVELSKKNCTKQITQAGKTSCSTARGERGAW